MKVKNQKETKKDEFRRNKKTGHPAYIFAKVGNEYKFIGTTHSKITEGMENIKLDKNPNPKDKKTAYARPKTERGKTNDFKKKEEGWKLAKSDRAKVDKIKTQSEGKPKAKPKN